MNIFIVDTEQIDLSTATEIFKNCRKKLGQEILVIPKGIDVMQDVSVDWMIMIRDMLDERIKNESNKRRI